MIALKCFHTYDDGYTNYGKICVGFLKLACVGSAVLPLDRTVSDGKFHWLRGNKIICIPLQSGTC